MVLVKEIRARLRGTYVNNVYSLGGGQIVRFRQPGGGDQWLVVSPKHGAWVSDNVSERAETTPFTTSLRGEIARCKFVESTQGDFDRVFDIELQDGESVKHLILELMPPGNLVVTGGDMKVRLAQREVRSPRRRLVRGEGYRLPEQKRVSPDGVTSEKLSEILSSQKTVGGAIGRGISLPRKYVAEVVGRLSLSEDSPAAALQGRELEAVDLLKWILAEARDRPVPSLCETPNGPEIFVVGSRAFKAVRTAASVSELCDEVFLHDLKEETRAADAAGPDKRREAEITIERLKSQRDGQQARARELRLLAARAQGAATLVEARAVLAEASLSERGEPQSGAAIASALYDEAKRFEVKAGEAGKAIEDLSRKVSKTKARKKSPTVQLKKSKEEWFQKFRWFFTSSGLLAVGGRDAQSNSILVKRHLEKGDTVYHADLFGSPFFVLKGGRAQAVEDIRQVAEATVSFSSAWKTGLGSADAYWVYNDQVSAAAPTGEFLSRGSFMINGRKNMVPHNPVQVAVGLDSEGRLVAGPESAIARACAFWVLVTPHREKASDTAKKVASELLKLSGGATRPELDAVARALPAGGGRLAKGRPAESGMRDRL